MMRLATFLLMLSLAGPSRAQAMEHYSNVAQDQNGRAVVGATVTVYNGGTTTLATIYSDNGVTLKANPFTTALDGIYDFYAADGRYDIKINKTGYTSIYWDTTKTSGLSLFDPLHHFVPYGDTFPPNLTYLDAPNIGDFFVVTSASVNGACDSAAGVGISLCRYNGSSWDAIGGGGGGGGASGLGPNFAISGGNIITGSSETKNWTLLGSGGQIGNGGVKYQHSSGKWVENCIFGGVVGACDKYVELNAGKLWGVKDHLGNVKLELTESTGKISNINIDARDAGSIVTSYKRLPGCGGDFVGIDPASGTAGHIWNKSPLTTAPTAFASTGTNVNKGLLRHPDLDGDYGVQLRCRLPANVTIGQVDAVLTWNSAGTGNYRQQIRTKCYADNATADAAFNTAQAFTLAAGTAGNPQVDTLSNITMTGCSAGNILTLDVFRNRTEASDTGSSTFDTESLELWAVITE